MPLETATYVSQLNPANPTASDGVNAGDDQIRVTKQAIVNSFPAISGAVTATHTELNYTDGVTSNIQAQLDGKSATGHGHAISDVSGLQTALDAKQAASTAITTANIGSQSVNYATSAGSASSATSAGSVSGSSSNGYGTRTVSTSDPSGGSDGDIWYKY